MEPEQKPVRILKPVVLLIVGLLMVGGAYCLTKKQRQGIESEKTKLQQKEFLVTVGFQLLNREEENNRKAMESARQQLAANFSRYHNGVPKFADDLTSLGTRY